MVTKVIMPQMSLTMQTGVISDWLKSVGDKVEKGEAICVVEGDKATVDIESPAQGFLIKVFAQEGEPFPVKQVIALVGDSPDIESYDEEVLTGISQKPKPEEKSEEGSFQESEIQTAPDSQKRKKASPIARRIAAENNIDLEQVLGSGPGGLISKEDVLAYLSSEKKEPGLFQPTFKVKSLSETEKVIATRMSTSNHEIPHFHLSTDVNVSEANALRKEFNMKGESDKHATLTDLFMWVASRTLEDHAKLNAAYRENEMLLYDQINMGLAVETPKGLMVVVIKDANKLTLEKLSSARDKLVSRAQAGEQMPEDLQGGTFTITNLGMFGIKSFDPLIIPGQSGILGVGSLQVEETGIEMINVTLACDHRIVSGVDGARFLQTFSEYFSEPKKMFNI